MKQTVFMDPARVPEGIVDFSYLLHTPAGKHGFAQARDGSIFFEDGTRAKFVGFNISGLGGMPERRTAELYAKRMAAMGVNFVRPTLLDWTRPGNETIYSTTDGTTQQLNDKMLDKFDYFVHCLKEAGIYLMLDIFTARGFLEGDDIEFFDSDRMPRGMLKAANIYSPRMIELQKIYATKILHHVNPYTGLAYKDEPSILLIHLVNENSVLWQMNLLPDDHPYFDMLQKLFNKYLLDKYGSREGLITAWTRENECALLDNEDPAAGTVKRLAFTKEAQAALDHRSYYVGQNSPARYADYMEFAISIMDIFVKEMTDHIRATGCRIPINTSNLSRGFADVHFTGSSDIAMNNAYFNHPLYGGRDPEATLFHRTELITTDPRANRSDNLSFKSNQIQSLAMAALTDKPFIVSEWNEYNANAFHSSFMPMISSYMCLNDWDGMMIYSYSHNGNVDSLPKDEQVSCYDCYNEPAVAYQFGLAAEMFLNGRVAPALNTVEVCVLNQEKLMLEPGYQVPYAYIPFISKVRTRFYDGIYDGNADIAVSVGFLSAGDLKPAKHAVVFARSPYADAHQHKYIGDSYLEQYKENGAAPLPGDLGSLGDRYAVLTDPERLDADFTAFSRAYDTAAKKWGLLDASRGLQGQDTFISDTGEIRFCPSEKQFNLNTPYLASYSGYPSGSVELGGNTLTIKNEKMTASLLSRDDKPLLESETILLVALGESATENTTWRGELLINTTGKRWMDTLEGSLFIPDAKSAVATALDAQGEILGEVKGRSENDGIVLDFDGSLPSAWFKIDITRN